MPQKIFDLIRGKRIIKIKTENNPVYEWKKKTKKREKILRKKLKSGAKIKVAFLIMYATSTQDFGIFEKMLDSDIFDPYIIINPDVYRSRENFEFNYNRSKKEMINHYGEDIVLDGYDFRTDTYKDFTNDFDMMFTNNPYDAMAHDYFKIKYWDSKEIPICYISYFYMGRCHISIDNLKLPEFSIFWKIFAENNYVKKLAKKYQVLKGANVVVTGYAKLDYLSTCQKEMYTKKRIILAPHHSIDRADLFGGFLDYYEILLKLPEKYPDIDFVFRPHPLLIQNLKKSEFWGEERTEEYLNELLSFPNIKYSTEGNYYDLFVNSDALIHDCGSFMAEYLCTGNPSAFLCFKKNLKEMLTPFGIKVLNMHYKLRTEDDIYKFIDDVVINGNDSMKHNRNSFAQKEIMINYPNATQSIYHNIIKELKK